MNLLVVGGNGFLGQEVTRQARRAGARVAATFHRRASSIAGVEWRGLDIRHRDDVTALVQQTRPFDETALPTGLRAHTGPPGALDVRLDCTMTQSRLTTRLRGAHEFLTPTLDHADAEGLTR